MEYNIPDFGRAQDQIPISVVIVYLGVFKHPLVHYFGLIQTVFF